jgi:hypothetical protein
MNIIEPDDFKLKESFYSASFLQEETSLITDGESEIFEGKGIANSLSFIEEILELKEKNEILEEELMQNKVV